MKHIFTKGIQLLLLTVICLLTAYKANSQYTATTLETGKYYVALAKDHSDNIYIVRYNGSNYEVAKYAGGNPAAATVLYSGLISDRGDYPWGLAVNANGDVFVTNPNGADNWEIIKLAAGSYTASVIHAGNFYTALAVDKNNNLLAMEYNGANNNYRLVRYTAGAEQNAGTVLYDGFPLPAATSSYPWGITTDSQNNIYLLDFQENSNGRLVKLTAPGYAPTELGNGKSYSSLTIDGSDNLYTLESAGLGTTGRVVRYAAPVAAGAVGVNIYAPLSDSSLFYPWGITVNSQGAVYVNDGIYDNPATTSINEKGRLLKLIAPAVSSIALVNSSPINATSVQYTVTFSGAVTGVTVASFTLTSSGVTGAGIASVAGSGTTYTVTVNTGTGDGSLRLDVNGNGISYSLSNVPYTSGPSYTIDKTAPVATLSINGGATYTTTTAVNLAITATDADATLQMQFSNDGITYSTYEAFAATKSWTLTTGDGAKTVYVHVKDRAGNVTTQQAQITLDQSLPETTIITGPPAVTNSTSATFTFTSSVAGSSFEASVDGSPFLPATSPLTVIGLSATSHTVQVRAKSPGGNIDPTPASYTWTIDVTPPAVSSVTVPANGYYKAGNMLNFVVNFSENVTVTGTPSLDIIVGINIKSATYVSSTGNAVTFSYTVQAGDMDTDGITVGSFIRLNAGTIKDAAANDAALTLNNIGSTAGVFVNTAIPSVALTSTAVSPLNTAFTVTATFSEAVTGLTAADFTAANGTVSNLQTTNNITYTVLITPTADGTVTVTLPANTVVNIGNNGNTASNTLSYTYDHTAPVVASVGVPANGYYKAGDVLTFTVNYAENVLVNTTGGTPSLAVTIGSATRQAAYTGGTGSTALTFSYTVVTGDLDVDGITAGALSVNSGTIKDAAGNDASLTLNSVGNTTGVLVDAAAPTVASVAVPADGYYHLGDQLNFTVNMSENVTATGTPSFDVVIGTATVQANYVSGSGTSALVFRYTVQANDVDLDGIAVGSALNLNGGTLKDAATNDAVLALNGVANTSGVFVYAVVPSVALTSAAVSPLNTAFTVTATFSEAVTGLTAADFTVANGTAGSLQTTDNITYTVLITPTADGTVSVTLPASAAANVGNNGNTVSNTLTYTYDHTAPVVASVDVPANGYYKAGDVLTFTVHSSENVLVNTTGGTPSLAVTIGSATRQAAYTGGTGSTALTFRYTVVTGDLDGDGITVGALAVNSGTIKDAAGNDASLTLNSVGNTTGVLVDAVAPTVASVAVPADGYYHLNDQLNFTVTMSENVTVTGTPSLAVTIGSTVVQANYVSGSGGNSLLFRYTVQAGDRDMDGIAVGAAINLNTGTIRDAAGNDAVLALNSVPGTAGVFVNTAIPSVALTSAAPALLNAPFTVTATFSEAVTGLTTADFSLTNATLSNLQTTDNITYTVLVTPTADGALSISLPANMVVNAGNNGNTASNTLNFTYDGTAPVISSVDVPANGYYKTGNTLGFIVHFSEPVTVTTTGGTPSLGITIGSATVQAAYTGGSGTNALSFAYTVQAGDQDLDGITPGNAISLNGGTIQDAALNNAVPALNSVGSTSGVFVYSLIPSVQIAGTGVRNAPFTLTVTFSEAVSGFTTAGINATNAVVSGLQTTDNSTYTVLVTPSADGAVTLQVPAGAAVNIAGTGNTPSNTITYTSDATAPVISAVDVPANGYYTAGTTLNFTVHFSENVLINTTSGTPALGITIGTAPVQATYTGGAGTNAFSFSYTVQNGDMDNDGISLAGSLLLNGAVITDAATNNAVLTLNNAGNTSGVLVNTAHPSVQVTAAAAARVNTPVTASFTFSEAVTGFTLADITTTNAAVSSLQTTDNITYTTLITPVADGQVTVQVPAGAALNIAGNSNAASNTLSFVYDATAPVIAAGQSFIVPPVSSAGTVAGQVTATEAIGTLQNWTLVSDGSGGAFAIDANGNILVKDAGILGAHAGQIITLVVTVSDGLNTSAPAGITLRISAVNQAPTLDIIANAAVCAGTDVHTIQLTGASAGDAGQTYAFSVTSSQPLFDALSVNAAGVLSYQLKSGATGQATITVTIKDNGGTAFGGVDTLQRSFTLTVNSVPVVAIVSDKGTSVSKGDTLHLTASGGDNYGWIDAAGVIGSITGSVLEVRPEANTSYQVIAQSAAGCSNTASISISVVEDFKIDATNILTPNGDGKNDKWIIRNIDSYPDNEVKIFDRAGRLVYTRKNYGNDWEGKTNGTVLAEGTYYYIVTINGGAKTAKGYITIIRDRY